MSYKITKALEASGMAFHELPEGDIGVKLEFDLHTGILVAEQEALHSFTSIDRKMGENIQSAIAEALQQWAVELASAINFAIDRGEISEAIAAIREAKELGNFGLLPNSQLLEALDKLDANSLALDDAFVVRNARLAVAHYLRRHERAGREAEDLLTYHGEDFDSRERAQLRMILASAAAAGGLHETAITIWRDLLDRPDELDAGNRGWAWRNISLALGRNDPQSWKAARFSADAFLEAGEKREAAASLKLAADGLLHEQPDKAVSQLDEMVSIVGENGLLDRSMKACIFHVRAKLLGQMGQHEKALEDALRSIELQRGLIGGEAELTASLHLAAIEASILGLSEQRDSLEDEAVRLGSGLEISRFRLGHRLTALMDEFDADKADRLAQDALAAGDIEVLACVRVVQATKCTDLPLERRLQMLERSLHDLQKTGARGPAHEPTLMAIATLLLEEKNVSRAAVWLRRILEQNPFSDWARDRLLHCLWEGEHWGDAAIFLKKQIEIRGEMPGLLTAYGRSLLEAGDLSAAVPPLTKAIELAEEGSDTYKAAFNYREKALRLGGTVAPPLAQKTDQRAPVTKEELEKALADFSQFVAAEKRMVFWTKGGRDHDWISCPEKMAQTLLHTFLKARFQEKIAVFEELDTGAGRLDVYIQLSGGMSVIVELKMCGFGYSSKYAAAGEGQILHYMDNRYTHLGFLLVCDARLDDFGKALIVSPARQSSISEIFVDVRPRVSSRHKRKR